MENSNKKNMFFSNLSLKKKRFYYKNLDDCIFNLKKLLKKKQSHKKFSFLLVNKYSPYQTVKSLKGVVVSYIIAFSFSSTNTFLHVTDSLGNLKFRCSAGLLDFKGKQKKSRILVLNHFFKELKKLKISLLKNKSIALHLNNVGFFKYFIKKNLKKFFFIKLIKNFEAYPYNGCRKRKKRRK